MFKHLAVLAVILLLPSVSMASGQSRAADKPLVGRTLDSFQQDSARIREQMVPGGKYGFISATEKSRVEARLGDMQNLLQAHAGAADLDTKDKVALVNAQEEINGILGRNDNNRKVCQQVSPVGSHIPVTTCRTYGEIMTERRASEHDMERKLSTPQRREGG